MNSNSNIEFFPVFTFEFKFTLFLLSCYVCIVVEAGDDISRCTDDVTMLLANHQTPVDIVVLTGASLNKGKHRLGIMWLILKLFKWTHFGVSCQIRQDFFVSQV